LEPSIKIYKRKYDGELKHIKIILSQERRRLPVREWLDLVQETWDCVLEYPEDFFGNDLPPTWLLSMTINKVFEGFLEDQRLVANQTTRRFKIPPPSQSKQ
jgi:DNA-directed RNA polymerase specialized sigma24 family protein